MRLAKRFVLIAALAGGCLWAQPQFDVVSIKPAAPPDREGHTSSRMSVDNARLKYTNVTIADVLEQAYKVQRNQITGPDWLDADRFDITGTIPPGERARIPEMLQALLAARFQMAVHRETKELPVYRLTVMKGGPKFSPTEKTGLTRNTGRYKSHVEMQGSMDRFVDYLSTEVGRKVIDATGLKGSFDLTLDWTSDDAPDNVSLFTALQDQLGLKLESGRGPVEVVVVDRADRTLVAD